MFAHYLLVVLVLWGISCTPVFAAAGSGETLEEFAAGVTVANVREKVLNLSRRAASNKMTVEEFTDLYFRRTAAGEVSPQLRRRFIANMRLNLRIVGRAGKGVPAAEAIRAERSIETVLFRLQRTYAVAGGIHGRPSSAGQGR